MAPPTHIAPVFKNSPGDIFWKQFIFWYESQQGCKVSFLYLSCVYLLWWVTICGLVTVYYIFYFVYTGLRVLVSYSSVFIFMLLSINITLRLIKLPYNLSEIHNKVYKTIINKEAMLCQYTSINLSLSITT